MHFFLGVLRVNNIGSDEQRSLKTCNFDVIIIVHVSVDPQERSTWRSGMRAASQLPGSGPTDMDDTPAPAR